MSSLADVLSLPNGAAFFRADLHIHSYGASHDVSDTSMTPAGIVATATREALDLISVTDHNEVSNVEPTVRASSGTAVAVIPGVELSTSQGHLLCYLPTVESLTRFFSQLSIADRGSPNSHCQQSMFECLNLLAPLRGFGVLAHIDAAAGLDHDTPGRSPHKVDVLCHRALLGIELKHATSVISFSPSDPNADRKWIGEERIRRLTLGTQQYLGRVLNSDAHTLQSLGRNAQQARRVTRYKVDTPNFESLRIALEDADARVRIEDLVPPAVPQVIGISLEGGFLGGQSIHFSSNLNCIVGGRGTGKSTAFEAVRCLSGSLSESKVVDSDAWPDELNLFWRDQAGEYHSLVRPKNGSVENSDDGSGPTQFDIDSFSQGEAAKIGMDAQTDPLSLVRYLDKFIDLKAAIESEETAREALLTLQTEIEKAEQKITLIPQYEQLLATARRQLAALQKPEVKELIDLQRELASERALRTEISSKLTEVNEALSLDSVVLTIAEIADLADPANLAVGSAEFLAIKSGFDALGRSVQKASAQVKAEVATLFTLVSAQLTAWKAKELGVQKKIDAMRRELEALKVQFDMSYIAKLAKDEAEYQTSVRNLKTWQPHLVELRTRRGAALDKRWAAREKVGSLRDAFAKKATNKLRDALTDLNVSLKYERSAYSPDAEAQIIEVMGWRTNRQTRAKWLVHDLTVPELLQAIANGDSTPILALRTDEGALKFAKDEAEGILSRLSQPSVIYALQRVALFDLPRLRVTRMISDGKGGTRPLIRDFVKLSLGQQQSVLLALILSSESNSPLIVDQPEDNLDGEFIYWTLVPVLRQAKERRQIIIVTHNPNVAVLGDAEQIIVMKALSDHGEIVARGSIDHKATRDSACAILEGAAEAFLRRGKVYGFVIS